MFTFEDDIEFDVYKPNHLEMILRKTYLHNSYVKIIKLYYWINSMMKTVISYNLIISPINFG